MIHRTLPFTATQAPHAARILAPGVVLTALSLAFAAPAMAAPGSTSGMGEALTAETPTKIALTGESTAVTPILPTSSPERRTSAPARPDDITRALELEARAWAMRDLMDRYPNAARLYREAADLRPDHDPQKVENLRQASRMSYYSNRPAQASRDAEAAARAALRRGDVVTAADAYVDAAWLAARAGKAARFEHLVEEATLLAGSPLLAEVQREQLLRRLEEAA